MRKAEMAELTATKPIFDYNEESRSDRLARKSRESPFLVIGLAGLVTACGVGVYQYKKRGGMSTSIFLMQLRVIAQGTVVGSLCAGMAYHMYNHYIRGKDDE